MVKYIFYVAIIFCSCSNKNEKSSISNKEGSNRYLDLAGKEVWKFNLDESLNISLPVEWQIKDSLSTSEIVLNTVVFEENCLDSLGLCSNMILRIIKNEDNQNLEDIVNNFISELPVQFDTVKVISNKDYELNSFKIRIVDFRTLQEDIDFGNTYMFFIHGKRIYTFFFTGINEPSGNYAKERIKAIGIISSLKRNY